eukprot:TRINITY_DN8589_c0_g1_i14.p3 TRINITY_DN8589_c0_g1~~TRINITY_DN8589_c0_g1_i14.p3  ORF type:complete len:158 (-),score=0.73 TRINITY_DN8589_c0_g1_i14:852-1325(-)
MPKYFEILKQFQILLVVYQVLVQKFLNLTTVGHTIFVTYNFGYFAFFQGRKSYYTIMSFSSDFKVQNDQSPKINRKIKFFGKNCKFLTKQKIPVLNYKKNKQICVLEKNKQILFIYVVVIDLIDITISVKTFQELVFLQTIYFQSLRLENIAIDSTY